MGTEFWEEERALEMDGGAGCTRMFIDSVPLNCKHDNG